MEKNYVYVLIYNCGGKSVIKASSANYAVIIRKKHAYDETMGQPGVIKKMYKNA